MHRCIHSYVYVYVYRYQQYTYTYIDTQVDRYWYPRTAQCEFLDTFYITRTCPTYKYIDVSRNSSYNTFTLYRTCQEIRIYLHVRNIFICKNFLTRLYSEFLDTFYMYMYIHVLSIYTYICMPFLETRRSNATNESVYTDVYILAYTSIGTYTHLYRYTQKIIFTDIYMQDPDATRESVYTYRLSICT